MDNRVFARGVGLMTVYHRHEARIWEAYCAWQAVGRDKGKLSEIAHAHNVTPYSIEDCHIEHTAD